MNIEEVFTDRLERQVLEEEATSGMQRLVNSVLGTTAEYWEPSVTDYHFVEMVLPDIVRQVHPQGWTTQQNVNFVKLMYGLGDEFPRTQAELAEHLHVSLSTVSMHKSTLNLKLRNQALRWTQRKQAEAEVVVPASTHIDDWLDRPTGNRGINYAQFVLNYKRMPAWQQTAFAEWMKQFMLFCEYQGKTYRVTGASRMGDVWLTSDYHQESGYELRVNIDECSKWGRTQHPGDIIGG